MEIGQDKMEGCIKPKAEDGNKKCLPRGLDKVFTDNNCQIKKHQKHEDII